MKDLLPYLSVISVIITAVIAYLLGRAKNKADAKKSNSEAESILAKSYRDHAEYWKNLYDKERVEKDAIIEKQLKDKEEKAKLEKKIDELEKKIDILTSQVTEFTIKYAEIEKSKVH